MIGELERVPQQILTNWLHGHALDEYAIGYDSITVLLPKRWSLLFLKVMSCQDRLGTRVRNTHRKRIETVRLFADRAADRGAGDDRYNGRLAQ